MPQLNNNLTQITQKIRRDIIISSTAAGTGHPTSSLSGVEVMTQIMFGGYFKTDLDNPQNPLNDRLIFSKGHASPLFYALYAAAGLISNEELKTFREFESVLEGHPTPRFKYTEATTGSLGQGLGIAVGMALNAKKENLPYNTFALMGDSEIAEGSIWEAMNSGAYYKLDNLIGIVDVNRLGQRGETQHGHDLETLKQKSEAFGWETYTVDGHNLEEIKKVLDQIMENQGNGKPKMILAKTFKGAGISFLENADNWHGKALPEDKAKEALAEIGELQNFETAKIAGVESRKNSPLLAKGWQPKADGVVLENKIKFENYQIGEKVATRKAYGNALINIGQARQDVVVLDAEMNNSTYSDSFAKKFPERYFEMFIAEQNMISTATGLAIRGNIPFASTFASFLSRAADQIRMAQYSNTNLKIMGSHCGTSIGPDGPSQMAVEDLAIFRAIHGSRVFYPSDAVCADKLVAGMLDYHGIEYLRCTRADTPVIYSQDEEFVAGGSKTHGASDEDKATVIGAGITLHEALKAQKELAQKGVKIRVIDLYSVKPVDKQAIIKAANETNKIITVEDHYQEGGIFSAVSECLTENLSEVKNKDFIGIKPLAVKKISRSGSTEELLRFMEIDSQAVVRQLMDNMDN